MSKNDILNNPTVAAIETADVFQPLARRAMFWRPDYLEPSAWMEHLPFAFWLMEAHQPKVFVELGTHHGTSYFSFCQAVERLGLETKCYAIDTWKGDEHAGLFDEKIFLKVKEHNETKYSAFSRLVRSTFDEALPHFSDGSIDLLHIDGLHTLEAVTHDFESWLPKLSQRAVVIMHDSNVRERNFGVFRLFEKLQEQYPSFEFVHGHGLGVLGIGVSQTSPLQGLYAANQHEIPKRSVQDIFARLGRACADTFEVAEQKKRATKISDELSRKKKEAEETKSALEKVKTDLTARVKDLAETRTKLQSQVEKNAIERGQLEERSSLFQGLYAELKEDFSRAKATADSQMIEQRKRDIEIARLKEQSHALEKQVQELNRELSAREDRLTILVGDLENQQKLVDEKNVLLRRDNEHVLLIKEKDRQIALLVQDEKLKDDQIRSLQDDLKNRENQLRDFKLERQKSTQIISDLNNALSVTKSECETLSSQVTDLTEQLADSRKALDEQLLEFKRAESVLRDELLTTRSNASLASIRLEEEVQRLQLERSDLLNGITQLKGDVQKRFNEIEVLTRMLRQSEELAKARQLEIQGLLNADAVLRQDNERLAVTVRETQERSVTLEAMLASANETITTIESASEREKARAEQQAEGRLKAEVAAVQKRYDAKLDTQKADCERVKLENHTLQAEAKALQENVAQRFMELATLTEILETTSETLKNEKENSSRLGDKLSSAEEKIMRQHDEMEQLSRTYSQMTNGLEAQLAKQNAEFQIMARQLAEKTLSKVEDGIGKKPGVPFLGRVGKMSTGKQERKLMQRVRLLKMCELFNEKWYLERYPDVKKSGIDPVEHYLCYGAAEMRDPGPFFNTQAYVSANADVADSGINPLIHYLHHGSKEGRIIESAKNA